jgi:hypothetical protein
MDIPSFYRSQREREGEKKNGRNQSDLSVGLYNG